MFYAKLNNQNICEEIICSDSQLNNLIEISINEITTIIGLQYRDGEWIKNKSVEPTETEKMLFNDQLRADVDYILIMIGESM